MIYTRFGTPVKLLTCETAEEAENRGEKFLQFWVTAKQCAPHPQAKSERDNEIGRPILDGKQFAAFELVADAGWGEILDACNALRPEPVLEM